MGVCQRAGEVNAKPSVEREQAAVEGNVMGGASGQAVGGIEALARGAVPPRLDMARQQHALGTEHRRIQPTEHALAAAVGQHLRGE